MLSLGIAMVLNRCESGTFCEFLIGSLAGLGKASFPRPCQRALGSALQVLEWQLPGGPVPFTAWLGLDPSQSPLCSPR